MIRQQDRDASIYVHWQTARFIIEVIKKEGA